MTEKGDIVKVLVKNRWFTAHIIDHYGNAFMALYKGGQKSTFKTREENKTWKQIAVAV